MTRIERHKRDSSAAAMLLHVYAADPHDRIICPVANDAYSTIFGIISAEMAVLRIAAEIEPTPWRLLDWYQNDCIAELGGMTAQQLVMLGRTEAIIGFLHRITREHES
ncbi:hypothetical protein [Dyella sp. C11]|uniref:hypothetical protein n=1 Tax=Dyella sp. C11 TaxID=2126991 RepID=UPI001E57E2B2|nr:hypothetical protein [Dyella sp. C11]